MCLPCHFFRSGEANTPRLLKMRGCLKRGEVINCPFQSILQKGRTTRELSSRVHTRADSPKKKEKPGQSSDFHQKTCECVRRLRALGSGPPESRPGTSPVPPRGSPVFHNALLATSRPPPSVARNPTPTVKGELPRQQEFKATLEPPTTTSVDGEPTLY